MCKIEKSLSIVDRYIYNFNIFMKIENNKHNWKKISFEDKLLIIILCSRMTM